MANNKRRPNNNRGGGGGGNKNEVPAKPLYTGKAGEALTNQDPEQFIRDMLGAGGKTQDSGTEYGSWANDTLVQNIMRGYNTAKANNQALSPEDYMRSTYGAGWDETKGAKKKNGKGRKPGDSTFNMGTLGNEASDLPDQYADFHSNQDPAGYLAGKGINSGSIIPGGGNAEYQDYYKNQFTQDMIGGLEAKRQQLPPGTPTDAVSTPGDGSPAVGKPPGEPLEGGGGKGGKGKGNGYRGQGPGGGRDQRGGQGQGQPGQVTTQTTGQPGQATQTQANTLWAQNLAGVNPGAAATTPGLAGRPTTPGATGTPAGRGAMDPNTTPAAGAAFTPAAAPPAAATAPVTAAAGGGGRGGQRGQGPGGGRDMRRQNQGAATPPAAAAPPPPATGGAALLTGAGGATGGANIYGAQGNKGGGKGRGGGKSQNSARNPAALTTPPSTTNDPTTGPNLSMNDYANSMDTDYMARNNFAFRPNSQRIPSAINMAGRYSWWE